MHPTLNNFILSAAWLVGVVVVVFVALFLWIVRPGHNGVLATLKLEDGSEYLVTQRCNWSAEPYTVNFYMRTGTDPWGWCYLDHQASPWSETQRDFRNPGTE